MNHLLLVEDDQSLGQTLKERLEKEAYEVYWASTLSQAREYLNENRVRLIILDAGLPDGSGFEFVKEIKARWNLPFIFVTAQTSAEDRLRGYELGAVEFIPKPFHLKELLMRVEHVLENHSLEIYTLGNETHIEFSSLRIVNERGLSQELSLKEGLLLRLLIESSPVVVSRDKILDRVWGEDKFPSQRTVDNVIVRLRQLLGPQGGSYIQSVRGVGYRWLNEGEKSEEVENLEKGTESQKMEKSHG